jgi:exodeoxyribonuclease-3
MASFKIATWNVNSLRVRLPQVLDWLSAMQPDVLALQETKLPDPDFPETAFTDLGYQVVYSGQRTYNGVAVIARTPARDAITDLPGLEDPQRRVLAVTVGSVRVINLYIPNGESVSSDKFQYKLNWLRSLDLFLKQELKKYSQVVVLGDFNIAPEAIDVHDPKQWEGHVLFSEQERSAFQAMLELGFVDCYRALNPTEKAYSWWDYRLNAYKRNLGLRIDHILASSAFAEHCTLCQVDKTPRGHERPSDHAPVVAEFTMSRTT